MTEEQYQRGVNERLVMLETRMAHQEESLRRNDSSTGTRVNTLLALLVTILLSILSVGWVLVDEISDNSAEVNHLARNIDLHSVRIEKLYDFHRKPVE